MKNKEDLIYDLIFSSNNEFEINISEYLIDVYKYQIFVTEILDILRRSKVMIIEDEIDLGGEKITWFLKLRK